MAMAAKMPMITTTISSSIRVKPLRFNMELPPWGKTSKPNHLLAHNRNSEGTICNLRAPLSENCAIAFTTRG
jgi:hypothetical protein